MSLIIETLQASTLSQELNEAELEILSSLFEVQEYKSGEIITPPTSETNDSLYVLAHGDIEVKIESAEEQSSSIHVLKKGDLAGMITFVGGPASLATATLQAVGDTQVIGMECHKFESLINTHPLIIYKVMRGIVRHLHGITRSMNVQSSELSNYIYRAHGRY